MRGIICAAFAATISIGTFTGPAVAEEIDVHLLHTGVATYATAFVAKDQGFFEERGLNVTIDRAANGSVLLQALVSNSAQMVLPTPTIFLQGLEAGMDIVAIASTNVYPSDIASGLVAGPDSGIETSADMEGKSVAVPGLGGLLDVMLRKWLLDEGVNLSEVRFVESAFPAMADMISAGQVDSAAAVEPFMSRIINQANATYVADYTSVVADGSAASFYVTRGDWIAANPGVVETFQAALVEAKSFMEDPANEAAVRQSIITYTGLPAAVIETQPIPSVYVELGNEQIDPWLDISLELGVIREPVDLDGRLAEWNPQ